MIGPETSDKRITLADVQEAYRQTGLTPRPKAMLWQEEEGPRCACAAGALCEQKQPGIVESVSYFSIDAAAAILQLDYAYMSGFVGGFDATYRTRRDQESWSTRYDLGYEDGLVARTGVGL